MLLGSLKRGEQRAFNEPKIIVKLPRTASGGHFKEDQSQGVNIGAAIDGQSLELLGGHIFWRPHDHAGLGLVQAHAHGRVEEFGHSEIKEFDEIPLLPPLDEKDIFRL